MKQTQQEQQNGVFGEAKGVSVAREGNKGGGKNLEPKPTNPTLDAIPSHSTSAPSWDGGASKRKDLSVSGSGTAAEMKKAGL